MSKAISGRMFKITHQEHSAPGRYLVEVCRTDVKQSGGWRKRWCAWETGKTAKKARNKAVKTLLRKVRSKRK